MTLHFISTLGANQKREITSSTLCTICTVIEQSEGM